MSNQQAQDCPLCGKPLALSRARAAALVNLSLCRWDQYVPQLKAYGLQVIYFGVSPRYCPRSLENALNVMFEKGVTLEGRTGKQRGQSKRGTGGGRKKKAG